MRGRVRAMTPALILTPDITLILARTLPHKCLVSANRVLHKP